MQIKQIKTNENIGVTISEMPITIKQPSRMHKTIRSSNKQRNNEESGWEQVSRT